MPRAVKPGRKRDGRLGPPQGYPKDPDRYADPANWKYPVHTPSHVSVDKETETLLSGRVKDYSVLIDRQQKRLEHDCVDFRTNRAVGRLMCKHLGAFLMQLDRPKATRFLRELLRERDRWTFE